MDLSGKVALVTGAARRVGRAIALELARAGCDVAVHYHGSRQAAEELRDHIAAAGGSGGATSGGPGQPARGVPQPKAITICGDLGDPTVPARLVEEVRQALGRLDILVNNASTFEKYMLEQSDAAVWERTMRVNLLAPALLARAAAPLMRAASAGRIINLVDTLADRPPAGYAAYCTSKAALAGLTRALAVELAPEITVNGVAPGIAEFPESYDQATRERHIAKVPLKRAGMPEEVARLVRFLAAEGDYINGQIINIDGGRSVR